MVDGSKRKFLIILMPIVLGILLSYQNCSYKDPFDRDWGTKSKSAASEVHQGLHGEFLLIDPPGPLTIQIGEIKLIRLTIRNNGTRKWLRLQESVFINRQSMGLLVESGRFSGDVEPGELTEFSFSIEGDTVPVCTEVPIILQFTSASDGLFPQDSPPYKVTVCPIVPQSPTPTPSPSATPLPSATPTPSPSATATPPPPTPTPTPQLCEYQGPNEHSACERCLSELGGDTTRFCKDKSRSTGIPRSTGCFDNVHYLSNGYHCVDGSASCPDGDTTNGIRTLTPGDRLNSCIW